MTTKHTYADKEISTNLLVTLKHMKSELNIFTQEASNEDLFKTVDQVYTSISALQRAVFDMMCTQGWYQLSSDTKESISKAYNKLSKSKAELCK